MQKSLFITLCVLGSLVSIDTKPWYSYDRSQVAYGEQFGYHTQFGVATNGGGEYYGGGHGTSGQYTDGGEYGSGRRAYNYVPENCPGCNIKTFGVGKKLTNTFNLPIARR